MRKLCCIFCKGVPKHGEVKHEDAIVTNPVQGNPRGTLAAGRAFATRKLRNNTYFASWVGASGIVDGFGEETLSSLMRTTLPCSSLNIIRIGAGVGFDRLAVLLLLVPDLLLVACELVVQADGALVAQRRWALLVWCGATVMME